MLDIKYIKENIEAVRTNCENRGVQVDLDALLNDVDVVGVGAHGMEQHGLLDSGKSMDVFDDIRAPDQGPQNAREVVEHRRVDSAELVVQCLRGTDRSPHASPNGSVPCCWRS